jgi:hypothetical protein
MKIIKIVYAIIICASIIFFFASRGELQNKLDLHSKTPDQFLIVCSPEELVAHVGDTIEVHAYVDVNNENELACTWSASGGKLIGQGKMVKWDFTGINPGTYTATVQVKDTQNDRTDTCAADVLVIKPLDTRGKGGGAMGGSPAVKAPGGAGGGGYITGRGFLVSGEKEIDGYGLYSYFLLGSRPDDTSRPRYLSAIKSYLRLSEASELLKVVREKNKINITYLPLKTAPSNNILSKLSVQDEINYSEVAAWILDNYDYEQAQAFLMKVEGNNINGPYLVSFLKPLSNNSTAPPYLYQDLSLAPPEIVSPWVKEFIIQAAKEKFWEPNTLRITMLRMQIYVGIIGKAVPVIMNKLKEHIDLKDKLKIT